MKPREPAAYAIPRFAVSRPVTVLMLLLTIVVVGFITYRRIPISMFPEGHEATSLNISVSYPNASPRDVEQKITRKIEDIIGTVPGVRRVSSFSSTGSSYVRVQFHSGTNIKEAYATLSDRMDRVKPDLPEDVDRIMVRRWDQNDAAIMSLVAAVPPDVDVPPTGSTTSSLRLCNGSRGWATSRSGASNPAPSRLACSMTVCAATG